jgi:hypothetical protein
MKKLSTYLFLFLFSFSAPSFADDISDFQIEGISIGDSLLDYFSEEEIEKNKKTYFNDKTFTPVEFNYLSRFETYNSIVVAYKTSDKKYEIYGLSGTMEYPNNIKDCYKKMDELILELSELFKDSAIKTDKKTNKHPVDKSGKSKVISVYFDFSSNDGAKIQCYDYSKESGYGDHLRIAVNTKEYRKFLSTKAY